MKCRNLSIVLFASAAACGGGKDDPKPVDSPTGTDGGGFFPNSRNDVFLITFPADVGLTAALTPDEGDAPDNATAVNIGMSGGKGIAGEMGIAGDHSDEYFERDTYLISTGQNVNQMTIRMDWDGGQADMDWVLFEEPAAGSTDFTVFASGTIISDGVDDAGAPQGEFNTFTIDPSKNYLLWGGVYNVLSAGGGPSLPKPYDYSIYGANVTAEGNGACDVTEGADTGAGNNNIEAFGGTGTKIANALTVTSGAAKTFCGTLNTGNFLLIPEADDPAAGTNDVDGFAFNIVTGDPENGADVLVTITGRDTASNTAIQGLLANGALQVAMFNDACTVANCVDTDAATQGNQPRPQQFFSGSLTTFIGSHGVEAFGMIDSNFINPDDPVDQVGPKTLAIFLQSSMSGLLTANIDYKIHVEIDNRNTRAGRISAAELTEANDN